MVVCDEQVRHREEGGVHDAGGPAEEQHGGARADGAQRDHAAAVRTQPAHVHALSAATRTFTSVPKPVEEPISSVFF